MLYDNQASYEPDMAELIDKPEEIVADQFGVDIETAMQLLAWRANAVRQEQATVLGQFIGILLAAKNQPAVIYAFALAAGLDQLNGIKSEAEVAQKLGCTRALISHYVVAARDTLSGKHAEFDILKFRKHNDTRKTYAEQAKSPLVEAKRQARAKLQAKRKKP